jgi:hypothetical protein
MAHREEPAKIRTCTTSPLSQQGRSVVPSARMSVALEIKFSHYLPACLADMVQGLASDSQLHHIVHLLDPFDSVYGDWVCSAKKRETRY